MSATHESRREGGRYSLVSITLHWTIAALILTQIPLGWRMSDLPFGSAKFELFQLHKSIGITILTLSLVLALSTVPYETGRTGRLVLAAVWLVVGLAVAVARRRDVRRQRGD